MPLRLKKRTLGLGFDAIYWITYKYRICMAAFEFKMSADSLINLAASTSACAEMILLSANLLVLAVIDKSL